MIKRKFLCVLLVFLFLSTVYVHGINGKYEYEYEAAQEEAVILAYDQALEMAIANNLAIKDIDTKLHDMHLELRYMVLDLETRFFDSRPRIALTEDAITTRMRGLRDRLQQRENNSSIAIDSQIRRSNRATIHSINEFEREIESLRLHRQQIILALELQLVNAISSLHDIDLHMATLHEELNLAEENLVRVTLQHELGFASARQLSQVQHEITQGSFGLDELYRNRYTTRQGLNYLLGLPLHQYTTVTVEGEQVAIPVCIDLHIDSVIASALSIRQSQLELDSVLGQRWIYTGNNRDIRISESERRRATTSIDNDAEIARIRNRIALQDAVERAELRHERNIRTMDAAIRRGFTDLDGLLALEATLTRELTHAWASLGAARARYELGRITRPDVAAAYFAIFQLEQDIDSAGNSMWVVVFMLQNPDLLKN